MVFYLLISINTIDFYKMAPPARIELTTYRLEGGCSIQLSYGDALKRIIIPDLTYFAKNLMHY